MRKDKEHIKIKGGVADYILQNNYDDEECFISQFKEGRNNGFYLKPTNSKDSILIEGVTFSLDKAVEIRDFLDKFIKLAKDHGYRD